VVVPETHRYETDAGSVRTEDAQQAEGDEVDARDGDGMPTKDARITLTHGGWLLAQQARRKDSHNSRQSPTTNEPPAVPQVAPSATPPAVPVRFRSPFFGCYGGRKSYGAFFDEIQAIVRAVGSRYPLLAPVTSGTMNFALRSRHAVPWSFLDRDLDSVHSQVMQPAGDPLKLWMKRHGRAETHDVGKTVSFTTVRPGDRA